MIYMVIAAVCYTITSLNDKYASAKLKLSGNETTFLMAMGTSFFMLFYLPFTDHFFTVSWQSFATVIMMAFLKFMEIELSVRILREMSAFEHEGTGVTAKLICQILKWRHLLSAPRYSPATS